MRVVSGIQPTGNLHLGNYLGASELVKMQDEMECLYFLADLHAISMPLCKRTDREHPRNGCGIACLRAGINKAILFNQAQVPACRASMVVTALRAWGV